MNSLTPIALELTQLIWRKDLEFGCIYYQPEFDFYHRIWEENPEDGDYPIAMRNWWRYATIEEIASAKYLQIIGHPVVDTDLFRWAEEKRVYLNITNFFLVWLSERLIVWDKEIPYNPKLPLYEQEEDTLLAIINIIKWLPTH